MKKLLHFASMLVILFVAGCARTAAPPTKQNPTQTNHPQPPKSTTAVATLAKTATPTLPPTTTSTPVKTPIPRTTSTPAAISPGNITGLQRFAQYELPLRGDLLDARWSQDGNLILARSDLGIGLLSAETLQKIHFFSGMRLVAELEDGRWLVWFEGQRKYLVLEGDNYKFLPFEKHIDELGTDLIARNGETAIRKTGEFELEVISLKSSEKRQFNYEDAGYYLDYMRPDMISPDGKWLVVWYTDWPDYHVLNLETLEVAYDLGKVYELKFSPDSQYLLTLDNGGIKVLQARNGIQVNRFSDGFIVRPTPQTYVYYRAMAWGWYPDNQHVGVVYCIEEQQCELYLWSMATGQPEKIIKGLPILTSGLDFSPERDSFLTVSSDGLINTWSMEDGASLAESLPYDRDSPVFSPDGRLVAFSRGGSIEILDMASGEALEVLGDYSGVRTLLVDALAHEYLLAAGVDTLGPFSDLWDLQSSELIRKFRPLDYPNSYADKPYCSLTLQGNRLACGENPLQIFDVETGALLYSNKSQEGRLAWAISPDGNTLASCTMLYDPDTYAEIPTDRIFLLDISSSAGVISGVLEAPQGGICSAMIFSPDGRYLAAQSGYIWRGGEPQPLSAFPGGADEPMAFNTSGTLLAFGKRLIRPATGEILGVLNLDEDIQSVTFDGDGYNLVFGTAHRVDTWKVNGEWQPGDQPTQGSVEIPWAMHPTPPMYDDFGGNNLNTSLWNPTISNGVSDYVFSQNDGVLRLKSDNPEAMNGYDLILAKPKGRSLEQIATFEARLNVSSESQGGGFAKIQISTEYSNQSWWTQCRLGNQLTPGGVTMVCVVGSSWNDEVKITQVTDFIEAEFDRWYTVRIELNPKNGCIQYYLDGQLLSTHTPANASLLLKSEFIAKLGIYSFGRDTSLSARFDDVRIGDSR